MLTLKADENLLTSAQMEEMPFLQVASFSHNKINTTEGINHPMLEHLILSSEYDEFNSSRTVCWLLGESPSASLGSATVE